VTAATICDDLSNPASLAFTAADDYRKGSIDEAERNTRLAESAGLFDKIGASDNQGLNSAVTQVVQHIDDAEPDATGQPYDASSDAFANLLSGLGAACDKAGSELTITAHGG
jgi:hypothetical protein